MNAPTPDRTHCEYADSYSNVVVTSEEFRVIVCKDDWQWVIQQKRGIRHGQPRWMNLSYCRSQEAICRLWSGLHGGSGACEEWPMLSNLPAIFGGPLDG